MGIIYPSSMLSKPRGLVASGFDPISAFGSDLALWLDPSYGVYTDRSTQLVAASSQYWTRTDNASLSAGDIDFWFACWVKPSTLGTRVIANKGTFTMPGNYEWNLYTDANKFNVDVSNGSSATSLVGPAATNAVWNFVLFWHDAVNDTINLKVDNGTTSSAACAHGSWDSTQPLYLGGDPTATLHWNGDIDSGMFGKNPVGGIAGVIADINTYLFNSAAGRVSADISAAQATAWGLVSAWDFDGDGLDAHGSNDLTAVNSPTYTSGIASATAGDGDVESLLTPRTGSNGTPPSYAARPIWTAGNGKPYHLFDGSNDSISFGDVAAWDRGTGAFTLMFAAKGGDADDVAISKSDFLGLDNGILIYRSLGTHWRYLAGVVDDISFGVDGGAASIFTVVRSGTGAGQVALRRNGVEVATGIDSRTISNAKALVFGDSADAGHTLNGRLGDVVFVSRALTAGELAQLEAWAAPRQAA